MVVYLERQATYGWFGVRDFPRPELDMMEALVLVTSTKL
jgi:hypothetical protein